MPRIVEVSLQCDTKEIYYLFLCTENNNFNSILSELPRRRNSPADKVLSPPQVASPILVLERDLQARQRPTVEAWEQ